ncbi:hypothetical protein JW899_01245 [Candidatus Uhrbacteria bacterium]|nr:hypothetical protein [Candidatus Uhrbacteria bacterium]
MPLNTGKQFLETVNRATNCLITFRKEWNPDAVGSALALARILKGWGKRADIAADGFDDPKHVGFLPGVTDIRPSLGKLQKFIISLDVSRAGIEDLSYDLAEDRLKIYVTPKSGQFRDQDIALSASDFRYDLIVCLDTPSYDSLGAIFRENTDFFHRLPVVNIDNDPANERFGNINIIDITASSAAEVVFNVLHEIDRTDLDEGAATCLLTGLIAKTRSFRTPQVTPHTLKVASELIAAGGQREEIVRHLYRNRSLPTLKLWGRALSRLKHDASTQFAWTLLVRQDFIHSGASENQLPDIMEEMMANSPEAEICGVIYEQGHRNEDGHPAGICALISSERHGDATRLMAGLKPNGDRRLARICFPNANLLEAEKSVLDTVYRSLGRKSPFEPERKQEADGVTAAPELGHPDIRPVRPA